MIDHKLLIKQDIILMLVSYIILLHDLCSFSYTAIIDQK